MKPLEDELHRALRRIDPPAGFTNRVMARVKEPAAAKRGFDWLRPFRSAFWSRTEDRSWWGQRAVLGFAAMAAVIVVVASTVVWRQHRIREEQRRGELARAQVMQALHITTVKLNRVRNRVRKATEDGTRAPDRGKASRTDAIWERGRLARTWIDRSMKT